MFVIGFLIKQRFRVRVDAEMVKISRIKQLEVKLKENLEPEYVNQSTYFYTCLT